MISKIVSFLKLKLHIHDYELSGSRFIGFNPVMTQFGRYEFETDEDGNKIFTICQNYKCKKCGVIKQSKIDVIADKRIEIEKIERLFL